MLWKGPPHDLLGAVRERRDILVCSSPKLLAELVDVLAREKLAPAVAASGQTPEALIQRYLQIVHVVVPAIIAPVIHADPDDDHVLACALAARADVIVSGDSELLNLKTYQGMPIVTVVEAVTHLAQR